jgi:hypothetical protein
MFLEESMDILVALRQEEAKLQRHLRGIQGAILALNGSHPPASRATLVSHHGVNRKRTMSAAGRAKISKLTKEQVPSRKGQEGEVAKTKSFTK